MADRTDNLKLARVAELDDAGHIIIDGQEFPYWIAEDGPTVEPGGPDSIAVLNVPILVTKAIVLRSLDTEDGPIEATEYAEGRRRRVHPFRRNRGRIS